MGCMHHDPAAVRGVSPRSAKRVKFVEPTDVTVPSAVVAYNCDTTEDKLVGYVARTKRGGTTVYVVRRFKEWSALHDRLTKQYPEVKSLEERFPEKSRVLGWFNHTNDRRRLIEERRQRLDSYVIALCGLQNDAINAELEAFLSNDAASLSAREMTLVPHSAHKYVTFKQRVSMTDRLYLKLPWGYAGPHGDVHIRGDTAASARMRFDIYKELCRWFCAYQAGDRLPSLREVVTYTRGLLVLSPLAQGLGKEGGVRMAMPKVASRESLASSSSVSMSSPSSEEDLGGLPNVQCGRAGQDVWCGG